MTSHPEKMEWMGFFCVNASFFYGTFLRLRLTSLHYHLKEKKTFQAILGLTFNHFSTPAFLRTQSQFPGISSNFGKIIGFSHSHNIGFVYSGVDENILLGKSDFEFNTSLFP